MAVTIHRKDLFEGQPDAEVLRAKLATMENSELAMTDRRSAYSYLYGVCKVLKSMPGHAESAMLLRDRLSSFGRS